MIMVMTVQLRHYQIEIFRYEFRSFEGNSCMNELLKLLPKTPSQNGESITSKAIHVSKVRLNKIVKNNTVPQPNSISFSHELLLVWSSSCMFVGECAPGNPRNACKNHKIYVIFNYMQVHVNFITSLCV